MTKLIKIGDVDYPAENLSENGKGLLASLNSLDASIKERSNLIAVLTRAKQAYIADLKAEIISKKAGLDLSDI